MAKNVSGIGVGVKLPTRFLSPGPQGPALLEHTRKSLYSSAFLCAAGATIARETTLFNYVPGGTVPGGTIAATRFHTNMDVPGSLQSPEVFAVQQIRAHMLGLDFQTNATPAIDDDTSGGAAANMDQIDDITLAMSSCSLQFFVGQKAYAEAPLWMFPFNSGVGGLVSTSASGAGPGWQTRNAAFGQGRPYRFDRLGNPVLLWNQQTFGARVQCLAWGGGNPTLIDGKLLFVFLDGIAGRAVQ